MKKRFSERQLDTLLEIEAKMYGISKRKMKNEIIETYFVKVYAEPTRTELRKKPLTFDEIFKFIIRNHK